MLYIHAASVNRLTSHLTEYPHSSCQEEHKEAYIPVIQRLVLGGGVYLAGIVKGSAAGGLSLTDMTCALDSCKTGIPSNEAFRDGNYGSPLGRQIV